jgi:hypothetical protein
MNGNFSRNWGLFNTIRIVNSDLAEYYLASGNGLAPNGNKLLYGGKPFISGTDPGFTGYFQGQNSTTPDPLRNYVFQQTTAGEGCSIWNRYYYPSDLPPTISERGFPLISQFNRQYVPSTGAETQYNLGFGNNGWLGTLYPQLSRWYIPSIDELSFIAAACLDPNVDLQQKIQNAQGIRIGNPFLNSDNQNAAGAGLTGWVWSSTITFNEGVTQQYLQGITASSPQAQSGTFVVDGSSQTFTQSQLTVNQFSKAWSIKFDTGANGIIPNPNAFKVMKRNDSKLGSDNVNNRFELRLVRQIRCDRKFYWNGDNSRYRNTFWAVPRLTPSDVVTGNFESNSGPNTLPAFPGASGVVATTNSTLTSNLTNLNTFVGTIHKNSMRTN